MYSGGYRVGSAQDRPRRLRGRRRSLRGREKTGYESLTGRMSGVGWGIVIARGFVSSSVRSPMSDGCGHGDTLGTVTSIAFETYVGRLCSAKVSGFGGGVMVRRRQVMRFGHQAVPCFVFIVMGCIDRRRECGMGHGVFVGCEVFFVSREA